MESFLEKKKKHNNILSTKNKKLSVIFSEAEPYYEQKESIHTLENDLETAQEVDLVLLLNGTKVVEKGTKFSLHTHQLGNILDYSFVYEFGCPKKRKKTILERWLCCTEVYFVF